MAHADYPTQICESVWIGLKRCLTDSSDILSVSIPSQSNWTIHVKFLAILMPFSRFHMFAVNISSLINQIIYNSFLANVSNNGSITLNSSPQAAAWEQFQFEVLWIENRLFELSRLTQSHRYIQYIYIQYIITRANVQCTKLSRIENISLEEVLFSISLSCRKMYKTLPVPRVQTRSYWNCLNDISGWHTAQVPQDGLLFKLSRNLLWIK